MQTKDRFRALTANRRERMDDRTFRKNGGKSSYTDDHVAVHCQCDCGKELIADLRDLESGTVTQCDRCANRENALRNVSVGDIVGNWTILGINHHTWKAVRAKCVCGRELDITAKQLKMLPSCGCIEYNAGQMEVIDALWRNPDILDDSAMLKEIVAVAKRQKQDNGSLMDEQLRKALLHIGEKEMENERLREQNTEYAKQIARLQAKDKSVDQHVLQGLNAKVHARADMLRSSADALGEAMKAVPVFRGNKVYTDKEEYQPIADLRLTVRNHVNDVNRIVNLLEQAVSDVAPRAEQPAPWDVSIPITTKQKERIAKEG